MRQKITLLTKTMLLLCALVAGSGSAWAEAQTDSYTATKNDLPNATNGTITGTVTGTNSISWSYSVTQSTKSNKYPFSQHSDASGWQLGSSNSPCTAFSISTSGITGIVTQIDVVTGSAGASSKISVTVGGNAFGTQNQTTGSGATVSTQTFTGSASGTIVVSASASSAAFYFKSVTVTYSTPSSDPSITVTPASRIVNYDTEGGVLTVTLNKIDLDLGTDIELCNSDETTPATYDWIIPYIDGDGNVAYMLDENTDPVNDRTAYFKVYGYDEDNTELVYSDKISITQRKFTLDYATLPFSFDKGKGDLPTGMTHTGLGSDYSSSPKLKFDNTDDNLILKTKGYVLDKLEFDILGNSLSGTYSFKVQWSANGIDYTDLATYTNISSSKATKTIDISSCSGLKFIKWVYTMKSSGNVALGNIKVTPKTESISVTSVGFATYVSDNPLDYSSVTELKAYRAILNGTAITFEKVTTVPAGEGVLLQGDEASYNVPKMESLASWADAYNAFVRGADAAVATDNGDGKYNYILNKVGDVVGFYKAAGQTVAKNRAYLQSTTEAARIAISFGEESGIAQIENEKVNADNSVYNLQGQRVVKPSKGLYIVNGKKIFNK